MKFFNSQPSLLIVAQALILFLLFAVPSLSIGADSRNKKEQGFTVYVWDSQTLLDRQRTDSTLWEQFRFHGVNRLLISFNARQLQELTQPDSKKKLSIFIAQAREQHIRVELLLGDPQWVLPKYRPHLLAIINQLQDIQFTGLHLDIELNQLNQNKYEKKYLETEWLRTLQAVIDTSPWPVGISIHPRYIDPEKNQLCLGYAFSGLEIHEVILMIYVANPGRVAQIALPIVHQYPRLFMSIAQSVEPILSDEESYASQGLSRFRSRMDELRTALNPVANFQTIAIQSWEDLLRLGP